MSLALALLLALAPPPDDLAEDFEKGPGTNNPYDGWEQVRSIDHPAYNEAKVVHDPQGAFSGGHYLQMRTQGGTTALRMTRHDAWKIDPTRSYRLRAAVRLAGTRANVAYVILDWLDRKFIVLQSDRTAPVAGATAWVETGLDVPQPLPGAVWLTLTCVFEGPDVRGECAFDRLSLEGRPLLSLKPADRVLPIFDEGVSPRFAVAVPGLPAEGHDVELVVRTLDGAEAARSARVPLAKGAVETAPLAPGAYQVTASVLDAAGAVVVERAVPIIVPNPWQAAPAARNLVAGAFNPFLTNYRAPADLAKLAGFREAKIVLWDRAAAGRRQPPDAGEISSLIRDLSEAPPHGIIGVLGRIPASVFPDIDRAILDAGPLALFELSPRLWEERFQTAMKGFMEEVGAWQVGSDDDPGALVRRGAEEPLAAAAKALSRPGAPALVGAPVGPDGQIPEAGFYSLSLPQFDPSLPIRDMGQKKHCYTLAMPPRAGRDAAGAFRAQTTDLLRQLISLAASGTTASAVYLPVDGSPDRGLLDSEGYPLPSILALRAANDILSGATYRKDIHFFAPPVRDYVFEKGGSAFMAVWSEKGEEERHIFLGEDAFVYPPLGAVRRLPRNEPLKIGPVPMFVGNVDLELLDTVMSARLYTVDPPPPVPDDTIPLSMDGAPRALRFTNRFKEGTLEDVRLRIVGAPPSWNIRPTGSASPSVKPKEDFVQEFLFLLPPSEEGGQREIELEIAFTRKGREQVLRVPKTVTVQTRIEIGADIVDAPGIPDARRVSFRIVNRAGRPLSLIARIRLPNQAERVEPLGVVPDNASPDRSLQYVVRDVHLIDPAALRAEIYCEEQGGQRLHAGRTVPLR